MQKRVRIGKIAIGGGEPIAIQSMTSVKAENVTATVNQIRAMERAGATIARFAVSDEADAFAIPEIKKQTNAALVADIQFDHKLALLSIENGIDKVRLNPGNIGGEGNLREVAALLKERQIPVRVGSNLGSIQKEYFEKYGATAKALGESALAQVSLLEKHGVENIVISVKASSVPLTVQAYRYVAERTSYPLHVGVTEAGTYDTGMVKSSMGIGALLLSGIGDTIRVSLAADPVREVYAAKKILNAAGLYPNMAEVIACPTCGRCLWNAVEVAEKVEKLTQDITVPVKIAVMGCVVNGIGESRDADLGIAGAKGGAAIFQKGKVLKTVPLERAESEFMEILAQVLREKQGK